MNEVRRRLLAVRESIEEMALRHGRRLGSVNLLAVSKTKPAADVREAALAGQRDFGENHLQDAMSKLDARELADLDLCWHFIGPVQSNKTRTVAERFEWVHSVDRVKIADRLSAQRPATRGPLQVCIQVNVDDEPSKSGVAPEGLAALVRHVATLPGLRLRGLMAIPRPESDMTAQRRPFARLRGLLEAMNDGEGLEMDTLSMGMTSDLEAAIAEGATWVRVGTAIFGERVRR